ncbi:unnamed protein product [Calicophoron daubneyi]|uniref:Bromo domain-containing protein n=1 Tax=Calicophoron daubneyi TaxID=300641 RepID=A0AAV2TD12_CALDB
MLPTSIPSVMAAIQSPFSVKSGPGHITLEALLDSPGLTPPSPLSELVNDANAASNALANGKSVSVSNDHANVTRTGDQTSAVDQNHRSTISAAERSALVRDVCTELLYVLRGQDVNGYFIAPLPFSGISKVKSQRMGLLGLERKVFANGYSSVDDFRKDVVDILSAALQYYPSDSHPHDEAQRLLTLASDWFASIPVAYLYAMNRDSLKPSHGEGTPDTRDGSVSSHLQDMTVLESLPKETSLFLLNPDNQRFPAPNDRVRTVGEEAGPLRSGSYLLPNGGYREDRRNKVVPYTYLNYGPYYSFAPHYDSGASHCSPEANQLVLSTSWLPARTAYLNKETMAVTEDMTETDDITKAMNSEEVLSALAIGDHQLAVSLAVANLEQRATAQLSAEIDQILPGPEVDEDCVYSVCLANALTRDLISSRKEGDETGAFVSATPKSSESTAGTTSEVTSLVNNARTVVCDLDSDENSPVPSRPLDERDGSLKNPSDELNETACDLVALYRAQYRRLGDTSQAASMAGCTLRPSPNETAIAHRLVGRLVGLAKRARPRDLVHPYTVRKAMGIKPDSVPLPEDFYQDISSLSEKTKSDDTSITTNGVLLHV